MNPSVLTYPLITAPMGDWPLRCIYTQFPIATGQLVALSPLGYISLMPLTFSEERQGRLTNELLYLVAVLQAYEQRKGWLSQPEPVLNQLAESLLANLVRSIPHGQSRYLHQLVQTADLSPWLDALNQPLPALPT